MKKIGLWQVKNTLLYSIKNSNIFNVRASGGGGMEQSIFEELLSCLKLLEKRAISFPEYGKQKGYKIFGESNIEKDYQLIVNRKGHDRDDCLTYVMQSATFGLMVRLDVTGPPHEGLNSEMINTPHVHIFDEQHNDGKLVEPLSAISNTALEEELRDSLMAFLEYNNVDLNDVQIPLV